MEFYWKCLTKRPNGTEANETNSSRLKKNLHFYYSDVRIYYMTQCVVHLRSFAMQLNDAHLSTVYFPFHPTSTQFITILPSPYLSLAPETHTHARTYRRYIQILTARQRDTAINPDQPLCHAASAEQQFAGYYAARNLISNVFLITTVDRLWYS